MPGPILTVPRRWAGVKRSPACGSATHSCSSIRWPGGVAPVALVFDRLRDAGQVGVGQGMDVAGELPADDAGLVVDADQAVDRPGDAGAGRGAGPHPVGEAVEAP